jgi:hypothetical protein
MHERPAGESTDFRIRDYLLRVCGNLDNSLYLQLRLYQGMIRRWPGEMILVSFDDDENLNSPVRPLKKFLCGILSDTALILDEKDKCAYFPTGGKHLIEQSHEQEKISLEPINIKASSTIQRGQVYGPKSDTKAPKLILGDYSVLEWFKEKRGSDALYHQCQHNLSKRHVPSRRASIRALA